MGWGGNHARNEFGTLAAAADAAAHGSASGSCWTRGRQAACGARGARWTGDPRWRRPHRPRLVRRNEQPRGLVARREGHREHQAAGHPSRRRRQHRRPGLTRPQLRSHVHVLRGRGGRDCQRWCEELDAGALLRGRRRHQHLLRPAACGDREAEHHLDRRRQRLQRPRRQRGCRSADVQRNHHRRLREQWRWVDVATAPSTAGSGASCPGCPWCRAAAATTSR